MMKFVLKNTGEALFRRRLRNENVKGDVTGKQGTFSLKAVAGMVKQVSTPKPGEETPKTPRERERETGAREKDPLLMMPREKREAKEEADVLREECCREIFTHFDIDGDGFHNMEECQAFGLAF